jgi:hypothetical protein
MMQTAGCAKLLILLRCADCCQTVQAVPKQDGTSVYRHAAAVAHKVFHRHGGENQKPLQIINLDGDCEEALRFDRARLLCIDGDG